MLNIGGVDFGFSSSTTALYLAEVDTENQIVRIMLGREYDKKTPSIIADEMHSLHGKFLISNGLLMVLTGALLTNVNLNLENV